MSKLFLDLAKFKKTKDGKHETVFEHADGHTITVKNSSLSPKMKEEMVKLAFGGKSKKQSNPKLEESKKLPEYSHGGESSDPTQRHLLPGDKIPNAIEKRVVNEARHRMADGGGLPPGLSQEDLNSSVQRLDDQRNQDAADKYKQQNTPQPKAEGGEIKNDSPYHKSKHSISGLTSGKSPVGEAVREGDLERARAVQEGRLAAQVRKPKPELYAQGGAIDSRPCLNPHCKSHGVPHPNCRCYAGMARGGEVQSFCDDKGPHHESCKYYCEGNGNVQKYAEGTPPEGASSDSVQDSPDQIAADASAAPAQAPDTPQDYLPQQPAATDQPQQPDTSNQQAAPAPDATQVTPLKASTDPTKGFEREQRGIGEQQTVDTNTAAAQVPEIDRYKGALDTFNTNMNNILGEANQERIKHYDDMLKGRIDPEKYWENHSKVAAGIGLLLGGFNFTNGPNQAAEMLKYNIDNSIKAQIQNQDNSNNLYRANLENYRDQAVALNMTRMQMADAHDAMMKKAALQQGTAQAKAIADQHSGVAAQLFAPKLLESQLNNAAIKTLKGGTSPADMINGFALAGRPDMAKRLEDRYVPGVGMSASNAVTPEDKKQFGKNKQTTDTLNDLIQFEQQNRGALKDAIKHPGKYVSLLNQAQAKLNNAQTVMRSTNLGGVWKHSEVPLLRDMVGDDPLSVFNTWTQIPKLQEQVDHIGMMHKDLMDRYHMVPEKQQSAQPAKPAPGAAAQQKFVPKTAKKLGN